MNNDDVKPEASGSNDAAICSLPASDLREIREALWAAMDDIGEHLQVAKYNLRGECCGQIMAKPDFPQLIHEAGIKASEEVKERLRIASCKISTILKSVDAKATEGPQDPSEALRGWGPMTLATVQAADLAEGTVKLRVRGPLPHTIIGGQWFLFPDAPPAASRPDLDFLVRHTCSSHPEGMVDKHGDCVPCGLGWPPNPQSAPGMAARKHQ